MLLVTVVSGRVTKVRDSLNLNEQMTNVMVTAPTSGTTEMCMSENGKMTNYVATAPARAPTDVCTSESGKMTNYVARAPTSVRTEILILVIGKVTNAMALARTSTQATVTSILDIGNTANDEASMTPSSKFWRTNENAPSDSRLSAKAIRGRRCRAITDSTLAV